jgi:hypothetical protein
VRADMGRQVRVLTLTGQPGAQRCSPLLLIGRVAGENRGAGLDGWGDVPEHLHDGWKLAPVRHGAVVSVISNNDEIFNAWLMAYNENYYHLQKTPVCLPQRRIDFELITGNWTWVWTNYLPVSGGCLRRAPDCSAADDPQDQRTSLLRLLEIGFFPGERVRVVARKDFRRA